MENVNKVILEIRENHKHLNPINFENTWANLLNDRIFSKIMDDAMVELGHTFFIRGERALKELVKKELSI